jgi:hypothetical protein
MVSSNKQSRRNQTVPLIFEKVRSRVTREVSMPAKTGDDLDRYIEWASKAVGADPDEAMTLVMEHALGQFFARDRLFQEVLRTRDDEERGPTITAGAAGSRPAPSTGGKGTSASGTSAPNANSTSAPVGKGGSTSPAATTGPAITQ